LRTAGRAQIGSYGAGRGLLVEAFVFVEVDIVVPHVAVTVHPLSREQSHTIDSTNRSQRPIHIRAILPQTAHRLPAASYRERCSGQMGSRGAALPLEVRLWDGTDGGFASGYSIDWRNPGGDTLLVARRRGGRALMNTLLTIVLRRAPAAF
jgi:hypothetical protein